MCLLTPVLSYSFSVVYMHILYSLREMVLHSHNFLLARFVGWLVAGIHGSVLTDY